jgi:hypothetical protein
MPSLLICTRALIYLSCSSSTGGGLGEVALRVRDFILYYFKTSFYSLQLKDYSLFKGGFERLLNVALFLAGLLFGFYQNQE